LNRKKSKSGIELPRKIRIITQKLGIDFSVKIMYSGLSLNKVDDLDPLQVYGE
jgi:hypothetical protein